MNNETRNFLGWSEIVLAILIVLNQALIWAGWLQYVWGGLVVIAGFWTLAAKE